MNGSQAALLSQEDSTVPSFDFAEIAHGVDYDHLCAPDHEAHVLIRWGDPLFIDAPDFDGPAICLAFRDQCFLQPSRSLEIPVNALIDRIQSIKCFSDPGVLVDKIVLHRQQALTGAQSRLHFTQIDRL